MSRFLSAVSLTLLVSALASPVRAGGDKDTDAILDKAIKALGGEEKLRALKAVTWKAKGTWTLGKSQGNFASQAGNFASQATVQGLDHFRQEFDLEFANNKLNLVTVLNGDKGWRKFLGMATELGKDDIADEKRAVYIQMIPVTLLPLKGKEFKLKAAGEEKVNDKPAAGLLVTGPDGMDFTLYFDKKSGLPVKLVAKVTGFEGDFNLETTFGGYKEFGGIKKATKVERKRDGEKYMEQEITEFKAVDKVDAKSFAEPK
jgi:hypothetical protein